MPLLHHSIRFAILLTGLAASAQATTTLLNPAPLGDTSSTTVGYAVWDTFTDLDASGALSLNSSTPTAGDTDVLATLNLTASMTGGSVAGAGDRIYNGVGASSAAFNLGLAGTAGTSIDTIKLQLKVTPPDVATGLTRTTFFNVTLNGITVTPVETVSGSGEMVGGFSLGVIEYTWSGLNLEAGDALNFVITSPASGHVSLDALRIDASTVPEPSALLLAAAAGVCLSAKRRRPRTA